tara:strand:- start:1118 stop:1996 length:879 start_codon:yes stop_codon:yes gene_type:complete
MIYLGRISFKKSFVCTLFLLQFLQPRDSSNTKLSEVNLLVSEIAGNQLAEEVYSHVFTQLIKNGVPPDYLRTVIANPDIQIKPGIVERWNKPAERLTYDRYRKIFITDDRLNRGVEFYKINFDLFQKVSSYYKVDPFLILSIVGVESRFGENAQQYSVFNALHTIAHEIPRKKKWVQKELTAFLRLCYNSSLSTFDIRGSYAGAFGNGQFIPSSFEGYAVDYDKDGTVHPFEWPDVFASIANYLGKNGYEPNSSNFTEGSKNWKAVLAYNPSGNYARVVIEFRNLLKETITP